MKPPKKLPRPRDKAVLRPSPPVVKKDPGNPHDTRCTFYGAKLM